MDIVKEETSFLNKLITLKQLGEIQSKKPKLSTGCQVLDKFFM